MPGSTPSSGSSGSETAEERSSTSMMWSQASASSYPPPDAVPLRAARYVCPECAVASSMPLRVSLVNLQKFTFQACDESASIRMFAPAQNTFSLALLTTTVRIPGCSNRSRCTMS